MHLPKRVKIKRFRGKTFYPVIFEALDSVFADAARQARAVALLDDLFGGLERALR